MNKFSKILTNIHKIMKMIQCNRLNYNMINFTLNDSNFVYK
jgi:hypothetical protein